MPSYKHSLQIAALSVALMGLFIAFAGVNMEASAQNFSSTASFSSVSVPQSFSSVSIQNSFSSTSVPNSFSSVSVPQSFSSVSVPTSFSSRSFPSLSFSSVSLVSESFSSMSISLPASSISFQSTPSIPASSHSFSTSFSEFSFSQISFSAVSISTASFSFSQSSVETIGGDLGGLGDTGGISGGTSGGAFGGLIGIGGTYGGGTITTGGGGETGPKRSARAADKNTCLSTGKDALTRRTCIPLVQPLGGVNTIAVNPGAQSFIDYFNEASVLLLTVSVGFAVLWILIGSYFIMVSGSDGGKRSTGKSIITWAIIGLILVNFAGFFLRTLNSIFFT